MSKPESNIPDNSVYKELEQRYETLIKDKAYSELTRVLRTLLDNIKPHYQERNSMGAYIPMTEEQHRNLIELYAECIQKCEKAQNENGTDEQDENNNIIIKIKPPILPELHKILHQDYIALKSLQKNNLPPLVSVLSGSRVSTIKLEPGKVNNTVGGSMSSRMPIQYTDKDGIVHRGVFTADETARESYWKKLWSNVINKIKRAQQLKPNEKTIFEDAIKAISSNDNYINFLMTERYAPSDKKFFFTKEMNTIISTSLSAHKRQSLYAVIDSVSDDFLGYYDVIYKTGLSIDNKIAQRNCAMSDVAGFLGFSHLLAKSKRVRVSINGKDSVEGAIMEAAGEDCVDLNCLTQDSPYRNITEDELKNGKLLTSLADLQILDFICGNTDRHGGNYFIRLDSTDPKNPKAIGVLGIDNDSSFGTIENEGSRFLASISNIKVISKKMKAALELMSPEILQTILLQYNLSDEQRKAATKRLSSLKEAIRNNKIQIVNNEAEWKNMDELDIDELTAFRNGAKPANIFGVHMQQVINELKIDKEHMKSNPKAYYKKPVQYTKHTAGNGLVNKARAERNNKPYDELIAEIEGEYTDFKTQYDRLNDRERGNREKGGSEQFTNMANAFDAMMRVYNEITKPEENAEDLIGVNSDDRKNKLLSRIAELDQKKENLRKYAEIYSQKIDANWHHYYTYGRERWGVSKEVLKILNAQDIQMQQALDGYEVSNYMTNQLHSMMTESMRNNINTLKYDSKERAVGIKAMAAQERLWNITQRKDWRYVDKESRETEDIMISGEELKSVIEDINTLIRYNSDLRGNLGEKNPILTSAMDGKNVKVPIRAVKKFLKAHIDTELKVNNEREKARAEAEKNRVRIENNTPKRKIRKP